MAIVRENRWWVYQRERFPVGAHGILIAAFSASAVSYSALLRGAGPPAGAAFGVAFTVAFLGFFQLRLADEFKDYDEDCRYRPYRPVPRGLVRLRELGWLWGATAIVQLVVTWLLAPALAGLLVAIWIYLGLMTREFFGREWLKARPVWYLASHMAILPMIDFFATACDWLPAQGEPPRGLFWFVAASYANGVVIELGRKIRAPADEEAGVETYSRLWGRPKAAGIWLAALGATALLGLLAASSIDFFFPALGVFLGLLGFAAFTRQRFVSTEAAGAGKRIEAASGIWTLGLYLTLGILPAALHWLR